MARRSTAALVIILLAPALGALVATANVPCSDPRGCPDLQVDATKLAPYKQTRTFTDSSCAVDEGMVQPGTRQLLRFTTTTPNLGDGDLVVGAPTAHPEWFVYARCHDHYHFVDYGDYRLWRPAYYTLWTTMRQLHPDTHPDTLLETYPILRNGYVAGNKLGFCLIDIANYGGGAAKYRSCNDQGISVGWADVYASTLDGQWIDVTGVSAGDYVLEVEINTGRLFTESNYANNVVSMTVRI